MSCVWYLRLSDLLQTPDWCLYYFHFCVCPFVPHISPHWIRVRAFTRMEWGLLIPPYKIGTWFPLRHRTLAKCAGRQSPSAQTPCSILPWKLEQPSLQEAVLKIWWDKFLDCGTASKQLPRSPKTEIHGLVGNTSFQILLRVQRGSTTSPRYGRDVIGGKDLVIGIVWLKHYPLKPEDRYTHKQKGYMNLYKNFWSNSKKIWSPKNWMPPSPHARGNMYDFARNNSSYHPKKWIVQFQPCCIFVRGNRFYPNMHIARKNAI